MQFSCVSILACRLRVPVQRRPQPSDDGMPTGENRSAVILVVDDDPFVLRLIADARVAEGYEVETAMSGATEPPEYVNFLEEAGIPVLSKPFRIEDLQQLVERALQDQW